MQLVIRNNGPLIESTNYWDSPLASAGKLYLSLNAGAFRLLVPPIYYEAVPEMGTGKEVIVSRGPWPEARVRDGLELLFDDGSSDPFALHLSAESADRLPLPEDAGREWIFSAWVCRDGQPHKALELPCYYRIVPHLPDLSPYGGTRGK